MLPEVITAENIYRRVFIPENVNLFTSNYRRVFIPSRVITVRCKYRRKYLPPYAYSAGNTACGK